MTQIKRTAKPGYKTTEFWLTFIAMLMSFLLASGAIETLPEDSLIVKIVGVVCGVLATLGYAVVRASTKKNGELEHDKM